MAGGIDRVAGGWDVRSMRGVGVAEVVVGSVLRLHVGSDGIEVHGPARLAVEGTTTEVHAGGRIGLAAVPGLLDQVVAEVHAADSGALAVRFASGAELTVPVTPDAFGWVVAVRGRPVIRSVPGGGVRT